MSIASTFTYLLSQQEKGWPGSKGIHIRVRSQEEKDKARQKRMDNLAYRASLNSQKACAGSAEKRKTIQNLIDQIGERG